jgi:hypothetical protein
MNDGYLDADCVITFFFTSGFLQAGEWKHNSREIYYSARFYHAEKKSTITLEICVINQRHCINKSSIRILSSRHSINIDHVFSECAI